LYKQQFAHVMWRAMLFFTCSSCQVVGHIGSPEHSHCFSSWHQPWGSSDWWYWSANSSGQ